MVSGLPSEFKEEYAEQAYKLCLLGAINSEIADFLDIAESTFYKWQNDFPIFAEAIKRGKLRADMEIANKLYNRANGYDFVEEQAIKVKCGQHEEKIEIVELNKHIAPDVTSMIFWLKNRKSDKWRDKNETEVSGALTVNKIYQDIASTLNDNA